MEAYSEEQAMKEMHISFTYSSLQKSTMVVLWYSDGIQLPYSSTIKTMMIQPMCQTTRFNYHGTFYNFQYIFKRTY